MKRYSVAGDIQNQCFRSVSGHDTFQKVRHYSNIGVQTKEDHIGLKWNVHETIEGPGRDQCRP